VSSKVGAKAVAKRFTATNVKNAAQTSPTPNMWNHEHVLKLHNGVPYVDPCFFFLLQRQMKNTRVFHVYCDYFENSIFGKFSYVKKLLQIGF
jgi:hypothetical protein